MKPRIKKIGRWWYCRDEMMWGKGRTPDTAFEDWWAFVCKPVAQKNSTMHNPATGSA